MRNKLTIGELANAAGVPSSTVRYYERAGLLRASARSASNYRLYSEQDLQRLRFIRAAQATGFTLLDVTQLLRPAACGKVQDLIEERLKEIRTAMALTTDPVILETSVLTVQMLARQIRALGPSIARYEEEIERRFQAHPDAQLFDLPGSGPALAPRLLAAFGTDRDRFHSATEVQQCTGIAPVTQRSGKRTYVHWRWSASTFVRHSFHEFARLSIQQSTWARAYYELQRERGKGHHAVRYRPAVLR